MDFELHHIKKSFGDRNILTSVNIKATTGEIIGIFGRNGCGKTTLFRAITGRIKSDIALTVNGNPTAPERLLLDRWAAYLPQDSLLPSHIKLRDLIPLYVENEADQNKLYYDQILSSLMNNRPGQLSEGERKYAELLLAGYLRRPMLILDEPFTMLEPLQIQAAKELIKQWSKHSVILISDHYYREVEAITHKNMILENGIGHWIEQASDWERFQYRVDDHD